MKKMNALGEFRIGLNSYVVSFENTPEMMAPVTNRENTQSAAIPYFVDRLNPIVQHSLTISVSHVYVFIPSNISITQFFRVLFSMGFMFITNVPS